MLKKNNNTVKVVFTGGLFVWFPTLNETPAL